MIPWNTATVFHGEGAGKRAMKTAKPLIMLMTGDSTSGIARHDQASPRLISAVQHGARGRPQTRWAFEVGIEAPHTRSIPRKK